MTIEQTLTRAAQGYDQIVANSMENLRGSLIEAGHTDDEIEDVMAIQRDMLDGDRDRYLADLRAWLLRGGETLQ